MPTSLYVSGGQIGVVTGKAAPGKIKIRSFYTMALPREAMVNGVITDEVAVKAALTELRQQNVLPAGDISLVIDSNTILVKLLEVPFLSPRRIMEIVRNSFADVAAGQEHLIYDYAVMGDNAILATAIRAGMVESYASMFRQSGLELGSIDLALNCAIKLSAYFKVLSKKTYILSVVDGNSLLSLLFVAGKYRFSNRYRLLGERGTGEYTAEIIRNVSQLIQFNKSQPNSEDVSAVYFSGLGTLAAPVAAAATRELGVEAGPLPDCPAVSAPPAFQLSDYLYATGNLVRK